MPWKTFLKAHWGAIAAADFFSVEVLTREGLVRYLVLFVIDLKTRRVHVAGITPQPDGAWMAQVARNLTDAAVGPLTGFGQLIVDRDPLYTAPFRTLMQVAGVQVLRLPSRSPNLNAYAERFVRSIKARVPPQHIIPLGERHLRAVLCEFVEHYHAERNHQGLGNVIPFPARDSPSPLGRIRPNAEELGGVLSPSLRAKRRVNPSRSRFGTIRVTFPRHDATDRTVTPDQVTTRYFSRSLLYRSAAVLKRQRQEQTRSKVVVRRPVLERYHKAYRYHRFYWKP